MKFFLYTFASLFLFFNGLQAQAPIYNSLANPKSVVVMGNVRVTVLTPEMLRIEYSPNKIFEDKASMVVVNRFMPDVQYKNYAKGGWHIIETSALKFKYKVGSGIPNSDNLVILQNKKNGFVYKYGDTDTLNLGGTLRTLDGMNGGYDFGGGRKIPLENGLVSRSGWAVIDDSKTALFDGSPDWNWCLPRPQNGNLDVYFLGYGNDFKKALADYTKVAGKIPMPPKFAFGYWWSRYWSYSDLELRDLITEMEHQKIPLDVAVIDMDWHELHGFTTRKGWGTTPRDIMGHGKGWGSYNWNHDFFPKPENFLTWLKTKNIKTSLNLHPASGILTHERKWADMVNALGLDTTKNFEYDTNYARIIGWDTNSIGKNIPWEITKKKFAKAYFDVVIRDLEKQGVNFWWLDWQQGHQTQIDNLYQTFWINYTFFTDMQHNTQNRPMLFHRWGGLGNHRYQIGFSGDAKSTWISLDYQKYFTATAANVGYGYWSHDIGGHLYVPDEWTDELYTRWVQWGVFSPIFRTHATKKPDTERRFWMFNPQAYQVMRNAVYTRYAMLPYIYGAARNCYETGLTVCLPMYYHHPNAPEAYKYNHQYYFGSDIIANPVTQKVKSELLGATIDTWLPKGDWFDMANAKTIKGNSVYTYSYTLNQIPLYAKAGAIIPNYVGFYRNTSELPDTLALIIVPGTSGTTVWYDDAGNNQDYESNYFKAEVSHLANGKSSKVVIKKPTGTYLTHVKALKITYLNALPIKKSMVNQGVAKQLYDPRTLSASVAFSYNPKSEFSVDVEFELPIDSMYKLTDGVKQKFEKLSKYVPEVKMALGSVDLGNIHPLLSRLQQTPIRILYNPELAITELKRFNSLYPEIDNAIDSLNIPVANQLKPAFYTLPPLSISTTNNADNQLLAVIKANNPLVSVFYTTDGSVPTQKSAKYEKPIEITKTQILNVLQVDNNGNLGFNSETIYFNNIYKCEYSAKPMEMFQGQPNTLYDYKRGKVGEKLFGWVGFNTKTDITAYVRKPLATDTVIVGFDLDKWAASLPEWLEVWVSEDGKKFESVAKINPVQLYGDKAGFSFTEKISAHHKRIIIPFTKEAKVKAVKISFVPNLADEPKPNLLFIDEIELH